MDKTSKIGLDGWVSLGWRQKGVALQTVGIQRTKARRGKSTKHEHWGNWSVWITHVQRGWQEIIWGWNQISKGLEGQTEDSSLHFLINWNSSIPRFHSRTESECLTKYPKG